MKLLAVGLLSSSLLFASIPVRAQESAPTQTEVCARISDLAKSIASARDQGTSEDQSRMVTSDAATDPNTRAVAYGLIGDIYGHWRSLAPDEIERLVLDQCVAMEKNE